MAEDTKVEEKKKNRIPVFDRLNQKYGKEEVDKRVGAAADAPTGDFYRFEKNEQVFIKQHPVAIYSPSKFKFSDDGWGFVGNLQRLEEVATSKETGEAALIYPFGLNENQLWELIGQVKGIFPRWSSEIDSDIEILDGLLVDIDVREFDYEKANGDIEKRKKVRFSIVKDKDGRDGYYNRLEWLKVKISGTKTESSIPTPVSPDVTKPVAESPKVENLNFQ